MTEITYVVGDATDPVGDRPQIIAHIVNDVGAWGAGFVLALSRRWPEPEAQYRRVFRESMEKWGRFPGLDAVFMVKVGEGLHVANMVAQHGTRGRDNPHPLDYGALRKCLRIVGTGALMMGASVHMPRIGCGLAGGRWGLVEPLIVEQLCSRGVPVAVYDLQSPDDVSP
ncbi:Appr-1-p processing domain protein [Catenulispora acidiphila DSM 44928]|uniref:Appr-1-p processing domain protein n=1 Tax=Catenulispora acidiphila (strain DSM 44928 / JCM 14897 / NBRC 102108 / NRRL B-24433 / ID139908) TaxID=479433 RepID=C7Q2U7_CATAD|nr:macro domain-containing protein [Catenulispora acidiphila]ACU71839.1 Appr-1-p processing domain protein [Catenulispora acidiphila DSM 44928]